MNRLRKAVLLLFLLLLVVGGGWFLVRLRHAKGPLLVSRNDPPKLRLEETVHDFGTITKGAQVPYSFQIHNVGGENLVIKGVEGTCGCAVINIKDKVIEPGKTGELEVVLDSATENGYVRQQLTVDSNDPRHPETQIRITANVLDDMAQN